MPLPVIVKPSSSDLNVIALDGFLPLLFRHAPAGSHVTIDLRGLHYIDLFSAIGILHCCGELVETRHCGVRLLISDDGACSFLPRMGFLTCIPDGVEVVHSFTDTRLQWEDGYRGTNAKFLEITPITSGPIVDGILDLLINVVHYNLRYRMNEALDLAQAFSEISRNVLDHNPGGAHGFAAMQVCRGSGGRYLQFVVADRGLGILTTLRKNVTFARLRSDNEAIIAGTKPGVSEFGEEAARGNGLHLLTQMVAQHGAQVHIRSGAGRVFWGPYARDGLDINVPNMQGVQISLRFPARTKECHED